MERFEFQPARWWVLRVFSHNPLLRRTDRLEGLMIALAVVLAMVAAAFAGALGTVVHDVQSRAYAEQARTRHTVVATAIEDATVAGRWDAVSITARARWQADAVERTGVLNWDHAVKAGASMQIWVDSNGANVDPPRPASRAGFDAVLIALAAWLSIDLTLVGLVAAVHTRLDRMRYEGWEHQMRHLLDDGGRPNRQP